MITHNLVSWCSVIKQFSNLEAEPMAGKSKKIRYEVKDGDKWIKASKACPTSKGWLEYEIWERDKFNAREVTVALAKPGTWRVVG